MYVGLQSVRRWRSVCPFNACGDWSPSDHHL